MTNETFIKLKNVSFSYDEGNNTPEVPAINDISLEIEKGSFVAVLGHNGSGKSTLAKLLNLILSPTSGSIYIGDIELTDPKLSEADVLKIRKNIGMVFQNPDNQLVATIVEEDVAFGPENLGLEPSEIRKRVDDALELVGMTEYKRHSPHQLSGGQKQRVAIAGIIAMMPECIVFDESTAMLDPAGRKEVMETILKLNHEYNITIIHITHYMNEALLADRVIVMNEGSVIADSTPYNVFTNVKIIKSAGLDVPQQYDLIHELNEMGHKIRQPDTLSIDDCAKSIYDYYKNLGK